MYARLQTVKSFRNSNNTLNWKINLAAHGLVFLAGRRCGHCLSKGGQWLHCWDHCFDASRQGCQFCRIWEEVKRSQDVISHHVSKHLLCKIIIDYRVFFSCFRRQLLTDKESYLQVPLGTAWLHWGVLTDFRNRSWHCPPEVPPKVVTSRRRGRHFFVSWVSRAQLIQYILSRFWKLFQYSECKSGPFVDILKVKHWVIDTRYCNHLVASRRFCLKAPRSSMPRWKGSDMSRWLLGYQGSLDRLFQMLF